MKNPIPAIKEKVVKHRNVLLLAVITLPVIAAQAKNINIMTNFIEKKGLMAELTTGVVAELVE